MQEDQAMSLLTSLSKVCSEAGPLLVSLGHLSKDVARCFHQA